MVPSLRYVKKRSPSLHKTYLWQVTRSYSNPKHPTRLRWNICHIFCARQFLDIVHFIQLAPRKQRDIDIIVDVWTLLHAVCGTFLFYDDELLDMNILAHQSVSGLCLYTRLSCYIGATAKV